MLRLFNKPRVLLFNLDKLLPKLSLYTKPTAPTKKVQPSEFEFFAGCVQSAKENDEHWRYLNKAFDFKESSFDELVNSFCVSTETCSDEVASRLIEKLPELNDGQLIQILTNLQRFPQDTKKSKEKFYEIWTELDEVCYERGRKWSQQTLLKVCSLWFKFNVRSKFIEGALMKLRRGFQKLPKKIFIETLLYLTACRRDLPIALLEMRFIELFDDLTTSEIAIVCMALYKSEYWIQNAEITGKLFDKTIKEIDTIDEVELQYFLKQLRLSSETSHTEKLEKLCNTLQPKIDGYCLKTCLHIGLLGTNSQYCHQELIGAVVKRFNNEIKQAIFKNFADLTHILCHLNFKTECGIEKQLIAKIVQEMKLRVDEAVKVPRSLVTTMNNLTMCGVHDVEIIEAVLNQKFIKFAYGKQRFNIAAEILSLESFTRINLKDSYDGPQLCPIIRSCIMKGNFHVAPSRDKNLKMSCRTLLDIRDLMENQFGKNMLFNVLPHFKRPDIIHCFDKNGKSVTEDIIDCFPTEFSGEIVSKDFLLSKKFPGRLDDLQMVAVILGYSNLFLKDTDQPVGELQMKLSQLKLIGYKTVVIRWDDWFNSRFQDRKKLLNDGIEKVLKQNI